MARIMIDPEKLINVWAAGDAKNPLIKDGDKFYCKYDAIRFRVDAGLLFAIIFMFEGQDVYELAPEYAHDLRVCDLRITGLDGRIRFSINEP